MYTRRTGLARQGWKVARWSTISPRAAGGLHHHLVHARRVLACVDLRNPPHAHENVGVATQHELLERANLAQVVRLCRPEDALSQVADDPVGFAPVDGVPDRSVPRVRLLAGAWHLTCPSGWLPLLRTSGQVVQHRPGSRPKHRPGRGTGAVARRGRFATAADVSTTGVDLGAGDRAWSWALASANWPDGPGTTCR